MCSCKKNFFSIGWDGLDMVARNPPNGVVSEKRWTPRDPNFRLGCSTINQLCWGVPHDELETPKCIQMHPNVLNSMDLYLEVQQTSRCAGAPLSMAFSTEALQCSAAARCSGTQSGDDHVVDQSKMKVSNP